MEKKSSNTPTLPARRGSDMPSWRYGELDDIFNRLASPIFGEVQGLLQRYGPDIRQPMTRVIPKDNGYEARFELPGVKREDITLTYENERLNVSAVHDKTEEKNGRTLQEHESFQRSIYLPGVEETKIDARYDNGVLIATLPYRKSPTTTRIPVSELEESVKKN